MSIETINAAQPTVTNQKWYITKENKVNAQQTYGDAKDIASTLGILASIGIATVALAKSKGKVADYTKKLTSDVNKEINRAIDEAIDKVRVELGRGANENEKALSMQPLANSNVQVRPEQALISEWENYTPDSLSKSPALRERRKEIKRILAQRGYAYDRKIGQFVQRQENQAFHFSNSAKAKEADYDQAKVYMLNNYLKTLPKDKWQSITMNNEGKDYIVANILEKEFNLKSENVDDLREQCRTLKKFNRVIKGKVVGSDAPKIELQNEINALIEKITARIDEVKK